MSFKGITGAGHLEQGSAVAALDELRGLSQVPIAVGFGIRDAQGAATLGAHAEPIVIGSALVERLAGAGHASAVDAAVAPFLPPIRDALHAVKRAEVTLPARRATIKTAPHSLIRLQSGHLGYITKRIDRTTKGKLAMEDMCQLTERLPEDKYQGSYEQIGKTIMKYSTTPGLDVVNFWELVLFSFVTSNADMHLKNFSLLEPPGLGMTLSPAYDLVHTALVNPADEEEMELTLNGKKKKLKKQDFVAAMNILKVDEKQQQNIFSKMQKALPKWFDLIGRSFLSDDFKEQYKSIIQERLNRIK